MYLERHIYIEGEQTKMKHYHAKPLEQLPKHAKSLQDDIKHALMKPETSTKLELE